MADEQTPDSSTGPQRIGNPDEATEPDNAFKARIAKLAASFPGGAEHPVPASDDLADWRRDNARTAWVNSLALAEQDDLADWTIDRLDPAHQHPDALAAFTEQIGEPDGLRTLVVAGPVGTGKTSAAIAVGNAAVRAGHMARFVKHATYLDWLRPGGSPPGLEPWQIERRYRECDLLVLDDLGAGLDTDVAAREFVRSKTLSLLDKRIDSKSKYTIVTTNQKPETISAMLTDQFMSRLSKNGYAITVTGPDRRGRLTW